MIKNIVDAILIGIVAGIILSATQIIETEVFLYLIMAAVYFVVSILFLVYYLKWHIIGFVLLIFAVITLIKTQNPKRQTEGD